MEKPNLFCVFVAFRPPVCLDKIATTQVQEWEQYVAFALDARKLGMTDAGILGRLTLRVHQNPCMALPRLCPLLAHSVPGILVCIWYNETRLVLAHLLRCQVSLWSQGSYVLDTTSLLNSIRLQVFSIRWDPTGSPLFLPSRYPFQINYHDHVHYSLFYLFIRTSWKLT